MKMQKMQNSISSKSIFFPFANCTIFQIFQMRFANYSMQNRIIQFRISAAFTKLLFNFFMLFAAFFAAIFANKNCFFHFLIICFSKNNASKNLKKSKNKFQTIFQVFQILALILQRAHALGLQSACQQSRKIKEKFLEKVFPNCQESGENFPIQKACRRIHTLQK